MVIIHSQFNSPIFNLAAEEYLLTEHADELLFIYTNNPSVIIGSNQAIHNEVDIDFCSANNIQIARRISGGGAVFHDLGNLNFCFISTKSKTVSPLNDNFLNPVIKVLTDLTIPIEMGKRNDLWLQGQYKITGTASHITKNGVLHHGTLLYDTNLEMLENSLSSKTISTNTKAIESVRSTVKNIRSYIAERGQTTVESSIFFELFIQKICEYYQLTTVNSLSKNDIQRIDALAQSKYSNTDWTYKK